jgi:hypothetical protein
MELCDATPSQVEQNLDAWEGHQFCPWNSYVKSEEPVVAGLVGSSAPVVAAPTALAAENFRLQASDYNPVMADLDGVLSTALVWDVVDSANRTGASCSPHPNAVAAFCWESGDNTTTDWYPQGITTSADASANGQYEGNTVVLASWYYSGSGNNKGARVLRRLCESVGATLPPRLAGRAVYGLQWASELQSGAGPRRRNLLVRPLCLRR